MSASVAEALERVDRGPSCPVDAVPPATLPLRRRLAGFSIAIDLVCLSVAYELALIVFAFAHRGSLPQAPITFDWSFVVACVVVLAVFHRLGLYRLEAYVSRPLQALLILHGAVAVLVVSSFVAFALKTPLVSDSRLTVFVTFLFFFVLTAAVRLRWLDSLYRQDVRERPGPTVVVGWFTDAGILMSRLRELRGFADVRALRPCG